MRVKFKKISVSMYIELSPTEIKSRGVSVDSSQLMKVPELELNNNITKLKPQFVSLRLCAHQFETSKSHFPDMGSFSASGMQMIWHTNKALPGYKEIKLKELFTDLLKIAIE